MSHNQRELLHRSSSMAKADGMLPEFHW